MFAQFGLPGCRRRSTTPRDPSETTNSASAFTECAHLAVSTEIRLSPIEDDGEAVAVASGRDERFFAAWISHPSQTASRIVARWFDAPHGALTPALTIADLRSVNRVVVAPSVWFDGDSMLVFVSDDDGCRVVRVGEPPRSPPPSEVRRIGSGACFAPAGTGANSTIVLESPAGTRSHHVSNPARSAPVGPPGFRWIARARDGSTAVQLDPRERGQIEIAFAPRPTRPVFDVGGEIDSLSFTQAHWGYALVWTSGATTSVQRFDPAGISFGARESIVAPAMHAVAAMRGDEVWVVATSPSGTARVRRVRRIESIDGTDVTLEGASRDVGLAVGRSSAAIAYGSAGSGNVAVRAVLLGCSNPAAPIR